MKRLCYTVSQEHLSVFKNLLNIFVVHWGYCCRQGVSETVFDDVIRLFRNPFEFPN